MIIIFFFNIFIISLHMSKTNMSTILPGGRRVSVIFVTFETTEENRKNLSKKEPSSYDMLPESKACQYHPSTPS